MQKPLEVPVSAVSKPGLASIYLIIMMQLSNAIWRLVLQLLLLRSTRVAHAPVARGAREGSWQPQRAPLHDADDPDPSHLGAPRYQKCRRNRELSLRKYKDRI